MVVEALEVLGLQGSPAETEVRRAYLRKVKEHPPERDPEGFRRVREAYDFLKRNPWAYAPPVNAPSEAANVELAHTSAVSETAASETASETAVSEIATSESATSESATSETDTFESATSEATSESATSETVDEAGTEADDAEDEAWKASFPPFVREQIEALNRALEHDEPAAAAEAMIELYRRPVMEQGPLPPPILTLRTFMTLVERGRLKLAVTLLEAFERYTEVQQAPLAGGSDMAARWKLAREVAATLQFDKPLARAVAAGLRTGQLFAASDAVEAAYARHGGQLQEYMLRHAPTLWSSLSPLVRPARREAAESASGFRVGAWPIGVIAVVLLNLVRLCGHESRPTSYSEPPRISAPPIRPNAESRPAEPASTADATLSAIIERQREGSWGAIESALKVGDCQRVREQWPLYESALLGAHVNQETERSRRREIIAMCSELQELLEQTP
jgi:hypothetical protein